MKPIDSHFLPSSSKEQHKVDVDLLEECWFFDNLFDRKSKVILRSNSDPCPSTTVFGKDMNLGVETTSPIREVLKDCGDDGSVNPSMDQAWSCLGRGEGSREKEPDSGPGMGKLSKKVLRNGLVRAPSLPPCLGSEEFMNQENENDHHEIGKLVRNQASANPFGALPPLKGVAQPSTLPRGPSRRIARAESLDMAMSNETKHRYMNQKKMRKKKSPSDLEIEELQGFKDLGFRFDKEDLSPNVVDILPGLQEKNKTLEPNNVRRPYLSEAWLAQSSAPPIPSWGVKKSGEDMKAQIKFWARAVASNVR